LSVIEHLVSVGLDKADYLGGFGLRPPPKVNIREKTSFAVGSGTLGVFSLAAQLAARRSRIHF
jgi:hypothetical protein